MIRALFLAWIALVGAAFAEPDPASQTLVVYNQGDLTSQSLAFF